MANSRFDLNELNVEIRLFGAVEVRVGGRDLPRLNSRRALWLLACLALRDGRSIERARLAGLLWPESLDSSALHNLRQTLSDLRRALGPAAGILEADTPRTIRLQTQLADIDVHAFDAAVAEASPLALERAAELYRGPLLEGCDEPWATEARAGREQQYLTVLEGLAAFHMARAEFAAAAESLRRAFQTDPYRESACRALMEALAANGEYAAAVDVYRELRVNLHRELNAEPDPSTTTLHTQIRARAGNAVPSVPKPLQRPGRLPRPVTEMIGREKEARTVCAYLQRCRMVTLIGLGGMGKTRLAVAIGEEIRAYYPDGAWFVDLAPISDASLLPKTVATALGVREKPGQELTETVASVISGMNLLLILDNCEHIVQACAEMLETLLLSSPGLTVLGTSRQNLGVIGELAWPVPSLSLPVALSIEREEGRDEQARKAGVPILSEAVELFLDRARRSSPAWKPTSSALKTIGEICCRLEGIPLAIELAAARVKALSPADILARLEDRFALLTQGSRAIARHQTLRAAMDWSYDLLAPAERVLLCRLSVFAGGWTFDAAQFVYATDMADDTDVADLLAGLVGKSLIMYDELDGNSRYRMLETVREYARDRLQEAGDETEAELRHLLYFLSLAEDAEPNMQGQEQAHWLDRLEVEHDNFRAALRFSPIADRLSQQGAISAQSLPLSTDTPSEMGLRLAGALLRFWMVRGYFTEGRQSLISALSEPDAQGRTGARAKALNAVGALARDQGDYAAAWSFHNESLAINQELGDLRRVGVSLSNLATVATDRGDYVRARALLEQALLTDREIGDRLSEAGTLCGLGNISYMEGDYSTASRFWEGALLICREVGNRGWEALNLGNLGDAAMRQGALSVARSYLEQALTINRELGERAGEARDLNNLGRVAVEQGNYEEARSLCRQALSIRHELGIRGDLAWSIEALASLAAVKANVDRAARLWGAAAALRELLDFPLPPGEREVHDRSASAVRHKMGDAAFATAFESGKAMDIDRAAAYALSSD